MFRTTVVIIAILIAANIGCADIYQSFNGGAIPSDWTIQGSDGTSMTDPGVTMGGNDFFGVGGTHSDGAYLRLTGTDQYERASAFWTHDMHLSDSWTLTMDIRLGVSHDGSEPSAYPADADGLTFTWVDASTVSADTDLLGGYGDWLGAPRDTLPGEEGYVSGIAGYSFQFDHMQNLGDASSELTEMRNLSDWSVVAGSTQNYVADTDFFYNDGWQTVQLDNNNGAFTFSYGPSLSNSYSWTVADMPTFDTYFGITGSTGERRAYHEIRNLDIEAVLTPEPGTMALLVMGLSAGSAWVRRRRNKDDEA